MTGVGFRGSFDWRINWYTVSNWQWTCLRIASGKVLSFQTYFHHGEFKTFSGRCSTFLSLFIIFSFADFHSSDPKILSIWEDPNIYIIICFHNFYLNIRASSKEYSPLHQLFENWFQSLILIVNSVSHGMFYISGEQFFTVMWYQNLWLTICKTYKLTVWIKLC